MNIMIISNLYPPHFLGGYEILCQQVVEHLRARGHRVTVLTSRHGVDGFGVDSPDRSAAARELELYVPFGQPAKICRLRRLRTGRANYRKTRAFIDELRPDAVFVWSTLRLTLGPVRAALDSRLPCAFTFNDDHFAGYMPARFGWRPRKLLGYALDRVVFREITAARMQLPNVTCISECLRDSLDDAGVPMNDAQVIYQGIPLEHFPERERDFSTESIDKLLYVGQLHYYKGVHTLIEAAHRVVAGGKGRSLSVTIAGRGDGEYENSLRRLAADGECDIEFVGQVAREQLSRLYRDHDAFVFPSVWREPFGLTHLEAMASGLPVISTDHGGQGEFLRHRCNALTFEASNVAQLASRIEALRSDTETAKLLARNGRRIVETTFNLDRYVSDIEVFLRQTAGTVA